MFSLHSKLKELEAELETPHRERIQRLEQELESEIAELKGEPKTNAAELKASATKLLQLTRDPERVLSVRDAEKLFELLFETPELSSNRQQGKSGRVFQEELLLYLSKNTDISDIFELLVSELLESQQEAEFDSLKLGVAFRTYPYFPELEDLAAGILKNTAPRDSSIVGPYYYLIRHGRVLEHAEQLFTHCETFSPTTKDLTLQDLDKALAALAQAPGGTELIVEKIEQRSLTSWSLCRLIEALHHSTADISEKLLDWISSNHIRVDEHGLRDAVFHALAKDDAGKSAMLTMLTDSAVTVGDAVGIALQLKGYKPAQPCLYERLKYLTEKGCLLRHELIAANASALVGYSEATDLLLSLIGAQNQKVASGAISGLRSNQDAANQLYALANDQNVDNNLRSQSISSLAGPELNAKMLFELIQQLDARDETLLLPWAAKALSETENSGSYLTKLLNCTDHWPTLAVVIDALGAHKFGKEEIAEFISKSKNGTLIEKCFSALGAFEGTEAAQIAFAMNPHYKLSIKGLYDKLPNIGTVLLKEFLRQERLDAVAWD